MDAELTGGAALVQMGIKAVPRLAVSGPIGRWKKWTLNVSRSDGVTVHTGGARPARDIIASRSFIAKVHGQGSRPQNVLIHHAGAKLVCASSGPISPEKIFHRSIRARFTTGIGQ
jgi:hypothetical protein